MKAVIFDMDGVIVDSEKFWQLAEQTVFSSLGVQMTDSECLLTKGMTTREVTEFWFRKSPWTDRDFEEVEQSVISRVIDLIETEHCEIRGVGAFIRHLKGKDIKVGLATNSPYRIIPAVLKKTGLVTFFDTVVSAESVPAGKPDPAVYLAAALNLGVPPDCCLAIEDSHTGIRAAKNAGITVVGYSHNHTNTNLDAADLILDDFTRARIVLGL